AMRKRWRARSKKDGSEFLGRHLVPVARGPKDRHYIIDHHHLCRALFDEGQGHVLVTVIADLDRLPQQAFLQLLDNRGWMHPFDENGTRRPYDELPKSVADLKDDPFRSLASALRRVGGYAKDTAPFAEFQWADFLRRNIKKGKVEKDFNKAL